MTNQILISFCVLLLIAYVFNITSSKTKIPSVILLLLLGWIVKQITNYANIKLPDITPLLPIIGTIGLILIVLEGSLELELNRSKLRLIKKSFWGALLPMTFLSFLLGFVFNFFGDFGLKDSLTNAIPFCIISSAIAIPSVGNLSMHNKEFVIYESSFSDILGILLFNFFSLNEIIGFASIGHFTFQLVIILIVSIVATFVLSILLSKIDHHIKFVPIILLVVLIYTVSKVYHLPGLIFILLFGLTLNNLDEFKHLQWLEKFKPKELNEEVKKFRDLTIEGAFIIRALFFLIFGYLIESSEVINITTLPWALVIVLSIFLFRAAQLKISKIPFQPLLFVAPRGLITILLFLSIEPIHKISIVNKSLIIQVIILTAFIMMFGLMKNKTNKIIDKLDQANHNHTESSQT